MKNGVLAGIVAPLYSIGLMLSRVNDMLRVDQYRRTSCEYESMLEVEQREPMLAD